MRNWSINIFEVVKHIIPHFLQKNGMSHVWITPDSFIWVTPDGQAWGQQSSDRHLGWIKALLSPLQTLFNAFSNFANDGIYRLHITGQVIYLEHYLNDQLDNTQRRIYIGDGDLTLPPYLYLKVDSKPIVIYNKADGETPYYLYSKKDYEIGQTTFIIYIPTDLPLTEELEALIRSLVDPFRKAGSLYKIENY